MTPDSELQKEDGQANPGSGLELKLELAEPCPFGCKGTAAPLERSVVRAETAPPALSGGTMILTHDAKLLVASDPERDRVYFVDVEKGALSHARELASGSEPGRVIEDDRGRIHVVLRSRGMLLSLTRELDGPLIERAVCSQPRGLAYDETKDSVHVACADGQLVTLPAAGDGAVTRRIDLGRDLRDVMVRGDELLVTRFRSAELLRIGAGGTVVQRSVPPVEAIDTQFVSTAGGKGFHSHTPNVAWRMIDVPGKGSAILHQRSRETQVDVTPGGYGGSSCGGVVQSAVTIGLDGPHTASADIADAVLAVDMAVNPSGTLLAVVSPGNWSTLGQLSLYPLTGTSPLNPSPAAQALRQKLMEPLFVSGSTPARMSGLPPQVCVTPLSSYPTPDGQATSVAFLNADTVALLEREPAAISIVDVRERRAVRHIELEQDSRYDTGYALFHMGTPAGIACASCHPEAGDDSHVWTFQGIGMRRTPNLRGGILGSEPFHWDGDMPDFAALVDDVFRGRMSVPLAVDKPTSDALAQWIDRQSPWAAEPRDLEQVKRGQELFQSSSTGCASCHAGPLRTNNQTVDVGTGSALQVPALRGVSFRLPVMHDGCAETLRDRFEASCGGSRHGTTAQLSESELDDLIAYLETL